MKCPVCLTPDLTMSDRSGVEIDYCPQCRGVWLDRGELDKILERAAAEQQRYERPAPPPPAPQQQAVPPYQVPPDQRHYRPRDSDDYKYGKRRKPWWTEIFD